MCACVCVRTQEAPEAALLDRLLLHEAGVCVCVCARAREAPEAALPDKLLLHEAGECVCVWVCVCVCVDSGPNTWQILPEEARVFCFSRGLPGDLAELLRLW